MENDLFLELDYPFLDISAVQNGYINFGALSVFLAYLLTILVGNVLVSSQFHYCNSLLHTL